MKAEEFIKSITEEINKECKETVLQVLDSNKKVKLEGLSTGSPSLNFKLSGRPDIGFVRGRIVEIYGNEGAGKTSLCLHLINEAHKLDWPTGYIDAEHALNIEYAKTIGCDLKKLMINQPMSGEDAFDIAERLIKRGVPLVIIDSVAALTPRAELDGEMGKANIALLARLMGQGLRKLTALVSKSKSILVFTNQIRMVPGVMFGCVQGETLVNFSDGSSRPIREVVRNKIKGKVWTINNNNNFEEADIIDYHINGKVSCKEEFIHIQTNSIGGKGRFGLTVTNNHELLTDRGWVTASKVTYKDKIVSKYTETINGTLKDFLSGCFVGDSHIRIRHTNTGSLVLQDSTNKDYVDWKVSLLIKFFNFKYQNNKYKSNWTYELSKIKKEIKKRNPLYLLNKNNFSLLGLAIWYMDDGCLKVRGIHYRAYISIKRFSKDKKMMETIIKKFYELIGIRCKYDKYGSIVFKKNETYKLLSLICKYIPKSMQYKLPNELKGKFVNFELNNEPTIKKELVDIKLIRSASNRQMRDKLKYDLTVSKNSNYVVGGKHNGVVIHNSPETTPGGKALKFATSYRLEMRSPRGEKIENKSLEINDNDYEVGTNLKIKIVKNKIYPPYKNCKVPLIYGKGFDRQKDLINFMKGNDYFIVPEDVKWKTPKYEFKKEWYTKKELEEFIQDNKKYEEVLKSVVRS